MYYMSFTTHLSSVILGKASTDTLTQKIFAGQTIGHARKHSQGSKAQKNNTTIQSHDVRYSCIGHIGVFSVTQKDLKEEPKPFYVGIFFLKILFNYGNACLYITIAMFVCPASLCLKIAPLYTSIFRSSRRKTIQKKMMVISMFSYALNFWQPSLLWNSKAKTFFR